MKILKMKSKKQKDIESWLDDNVGPTGYRWWIDNVHNPEDPYERILLVNLDLTEQEEEEFLTVFLLSNV